MTDENPTSRPKPHMPLPPAIAAELEAIRNAHAMDTIAPDAQLKRPLIVLDPGHGRYIDKVLFTEHRKPNDTRETLDLSRFPLDEWLHVGHNRYRFTRSTAQPDTIFRTIEDHGAVTKGYEEAILNLQIAKKLKAMLEKQGFEVELTRNTMDEVLPSKYDARTQKEADRKVMHLAIHCDSRTHKQPMGLVLYYSDPTDGNKPATPLSLDFARSLGGGTAEGHKTDLLISPVFKRVPAALAEVGNMLNAKDLAQMTSESGQKEIVETLATRIVEFYERMQKTQEMGKLPPLVPPTTQRFPFLDAPSTNPLLPSLPQPLNNLLVPRGK